jgi:hypothetical protein
MGAEIILPQSEGALEGWAIGVTARNCMKKYQGMFDEWGYTDYLNLAGEDYITSYQKSGKPGHRSVRSRKR